MVPCYNRDDQLPATLESILRQTSPPDTIVVIPNNYQPGSQLAAIGRSYGAEVFDLPRCEGKKAGALNAWFDRHLSNYAPDDLIMVMDADSILDPEFLTNAIGYIQQGYAACGGVFTGKPGGGFVGMLQRNEYARYARDVARKQGKTLVLTGTATVFTAACLSAVVEGRRQGIIPARRRGMPLPASKQPHVYDTEVLTEDNELTFALLHLGFKIIAPAECRLQTEVMTTWRALWKQRHRWKRGAIENNLQYGLTRHTAKYWALQLWGLIGIAVTALYLSTLLVAIAVYHQLHIYVLWLIVSAVFMLERAVSVKARGWKMVILASLLVVEMGFDLCLQAVHAKALIDAARRSNKTW